MTWWGVVLEKANTGDALFTPGRGLKGFQKQPFTVVSKDTAKIIIKSGNSKIPLDRICFETIEDAFSMNSSLWLRVAAVHDKVPFENSVDKLIREASESQLARGNYTCAILEHCRLVQYSMQGNKKGIKLSSG